ncbi:hypothetical protein ACFE04_027662 [Oxalis oulophora]
MDTSKGFNNLAYHGYSKGFFHPVAEAARTIWLAPPKEFSFLGNTTYVYADIPMAQFIINLNNSKPPSQKFIIHVLDNTSLFVHQDAAGMIRTAISEFRDSNSYEKPA